MVVDIIFAIAAGYGFYLGFSKGIISTVFTIISYTFGLVASLKFTPAMTSFLETAFNTTNPLMFVLGFLLSFIIMMVFIRLIASGLEGLLETANINIINQVAGGALLSGLSILVFSILLWFGDQAHMVDQKTKTDSFTYPYLEQFPSQAWRIAELAKPTFEEFWDHSVDFMDRIDDMTQRTEGEETIYDIEEEGN